MAGEAEVAYVLEHQPNIYCYHLYVTLPTPQVRPRVSFQVQHSHGHGQRLDEERSSGAILQVAWSPCEKSSSSAEAPLPQTLSFTLDCPGVKQDSMTVGIESGGEYLHVKVQPPPMPIDAHRLISLEQQSRERSKLPMPEVLQSVHCRTCDAPLHYECPTASEKLNEEDADVSKLAGRLSTLECAGTAGASRTAECENEAQRNERDTKSRCTNSSQGSIISAVHELPSENWLEMADLWVCGCCGEGGTRGRFKHFALEEIKAKPGAGLLSFSGNYLMLHASYFPSALHMEAVEGHNAWKPVQCATCSATLGVTDRCRGEEEEASTKLFFHCISSGSCVDGKNWFQRFSVETKLAQMVYELAKSRHCFRICAYVAGEHEPFVLIRVMNWATSISSSVIKELTAAELSPVVKVLYALPEEKNFKSLSDSWRIMGKGKERLDLLLGEADDMCTLLKRNAGAFPLSVRNAFSGQTLSFLCLDSRPELPRL